VKLGLSNHYGSVSAVKEDDKYYLLLDDYSGCNEKEISEELFTLIEEEFPEED
jgi:hypothetical protein